MTYYELLEFIHIVMAVVWIGGGATLQILIFRIQRGGEPRRLVALGKDAAWIGMRVFTPASIVLLLAGILMVIDGFPEFGDAWILIGIVGFLTTMLTGIFFLGPRSEGLAAVAEEKGADAPEVRSELQGFLRIARVDLLVLFLVIFDMVIKPGL